MSEQIMRRGRKWYVRFRHEGRDIWRSAGETRQDARRLLVEIHDCLDVGDPLPRSKGKVAAEEHAACPTIALGGFIDTVWKEECKRRYRSFGRNRSVHRNLTRAFYGHAMKDIKPRHVREWMQKRLDEVMPGTVNRELGALKPIFKHALELGVITHDPTKGVALLRVGPPRKPTLSLAEEECLLAICGPWLQRVVLAAIYSGCRFGELRRLKWRDIDWERKIIIIRDSKNHTPRDVPIHPRLEPVLREEYEKVFWKIGIPTLDKLPVLLAPAGGPLKKTSTSTVFKRACVSIERGDLRFHDLRHIFASRMLASGASLPEVADLLGHKTLAMSRRYAHSDLERLRGLMGEWRKRA